jgi:hypothetical protein
VTFRAGLVACLLDSSFDSASVHLFMPPDVSSPSRLGSRPSPVTLTEFIASRKNNKTGGVKHDRVTSARALLPLEAACGSRREQSKIFPATCRIIRFPVRIQREGFLSRLSDNRSPTESSSMREHAGDGHLMGLVFARFSAARSLARPSHLTLLREVFL